MAIGRMIRRDIARDGKVAKLGIAGQLLYTWAIPFCDKEGRVEVTPMWIKANIARNIPEIAEDDIDFYVKSWADAGLVILYENEDGKYAQFNNFKKLQKMVKADGEPTQLYQHEAASLIPEPTSCKIINGKVYCGSTNHDVETNVKQSLNNVEEMNVEEKRSKEKKREEKEDFMAEIDSAGYSPDSYKPMGVKETISSCLRWIKETGGILVPKGSLEWDNLTSRDRGLAKILGNMTTPIWLPMQLRFVEKCNGFKEGPFSPLVIALVKKYNQTERKALEE